MSAYVMRPEGYSVAASVRHVASLWRSCDEQIEQSFGVDMRTRGRKLNRDVQETRQHPGHFDFSVEVINPRSGWAELLSGEFDIVCALRMVEFLNDEGAKIYCKPVRALPADEQG